MVSMVFHRSKRPAALAIMFASILVSQSAHADSRQSRRRARITDPSDEDDPYYARVKINPFELILSPTPSQLGKTEEESVIEAVQYIVEEYAKQQQLPEGTIFQSINLADIGDNQFIQTNNGGRRLQPSDPQTLLFINGGTAAFEIEVGNDPPEVSQVSGWVEKAVDKDLIPALATTPLSFIQTTQYETRTFAPTAAPVPPFVAGGISKEQVIPQDNSNAGIIAGAVVGSVVVVGLVLSLLFWRRRKKQVRDTPPKSDDDIYEIDVRPIDNVQEEVVDQAVPSVDTRYADQDSAASVSEWTASSSFTSRTTDTRPSVATPIRHTESFELDRQVMLRKDMLYTTPGWSDAERANSGTDDTVLKPSYFSAKKEFNRRHPQEHSNYDSNDIEEDSRKQSNVDSLFLFEANDDGEEVYLMPPNQTNVRRQVSA